MSPLEIYAFFGVPAMFLAIGLGLVFLNRWQDRV